MGVECARAAWDRGLEGLGRSGAARVLVERGAEVCMRLSRGGRRGVLGLALVGLAAAWLVGCGPTQSTIQINEAEVAFEKARLNDAQTKAPYEFYSAQEYLYKAKEEWGYSDFEASLDYATLARKFAEEATKKSKGKALEENPGDKLPDVKVDPEADALE